MAGSLDLRRLRVSEESWNNLSGLTISTAPTRTRHEMDSIGLEGSDRKTSSAERARCAVNKRIKKAIQKIAETIPTLGHHLTARIKTGLLLLLHPAPGPSGVGEILIFSGYFAVVTRKFTM